MVTLQIPDKNVTQHHPSAIQQFLDARDIPYERWSAGNDLPSIATNEQVLAAYDHLLKPLMEKCGYQTADVISVDEHTTNLEGIREKFIRAHTHSEDEVRVFAEGQDYFWLHKKDRKDEVFALLCERESLISAPADTKHWFDLGNPP
jgi:1,2-dihydroxy-3-keto-5-methylthiopentene dioxygenase